MNSETYVIKTIARIDGGSAPKFDIEIQELIKAGKTMLVFDMEDTVYVSSAGLRVFLSAQKKINAQSGSMVLKNVKPQINEIFEVTGFSGILTII